MTTPPPPGQQARWPQQQYSPQYVPAQARPNPTARPGMRRWVVGGAVAVLSSVLALLVALFLGLSFGVVATLMGLVFALVPLCIVLPIFIWLDRMEAEPWRYLVTAFLYGALAATFLAFFVNTSFGVLFTAFTDPAAADTLTAVLVAPPVEESLKGAFILLVWAVKGRRFNGLTDGIVYAGVVAAGFAFTENILYLARALTEGGAFAFALLFVLRGIASPFGHPIYTSMIGIGIGIAASTRSSGVRFMAPVLGWLLALLLHGLWNLSASFGFVGLLVGLGVGGVVFACFIGFVVSTRQKEARVIHQFLGPYVATGWLSPAEAGMLSSMQGRRAARRWAKHTGGPHRLAAMRAFQDTASELALLRYRMVNHSTDGASVRAERVLLDSMTARRRELAGTS